VPVKDIHEILRQKEADVDRVRREIEALRLVISLLEEQPTDEVERKQTANEIEPVSPSEHTGTEGPSFSSLDKAGSGFWKRRR
jgi:hypothetical protein